MATTNRNHPRPLRTLVIFFAFMGFLFGVMALAGAWTPKLGLDLRGGTTITLTATNTNGGAVDPASLEQARLIIQQRVDAIGVGESEVATVGGDQITVSVPNVAPAQLQEMVGQTAQLYFRIVYTYDMVEAPAPAPEPTASATPSAEASSVPSAEPSASGTPARRPAPGLPTPPPAPRPTEPGPVPLTTDQVLAWTPTDADLADFQSFQCGDAFPDVTDQPLITCNREGTVKLLLGPALMSGDRVTDAYAGIPQGGVSWSVQLTFDEQGAEIFNTKTTPVLAGRTEPQNMFAIVLDSKVVSFPRVTTAIPGNSASITGDFTQAEAQDLANVLKYGALPLSFTLSEVSNVSPTLGGEQLRAGMIAGLIGLVLVVGFAVLYYRALALVVIGSLIVAAVLTYQFMVLLGEGMGFALNLPGVAGAIVAIGLTADSFIIYFERIRDDVREGKSLRTAIETGWHGSRKTILIADAVSLLSAIVLFILAIGSVKGFAFTLGLTTLIDIAVVFWFTKPLMTLLGRTTFFGEGRRFSGFESEHLGARATSPMRRRPLGVAKEA